MLVEVEPEALRPTCIESVWKLLLAAVVPSGPVTTIVMGLPVGGGVVPLGGLGSEALLKGVVSHGVKATPVLSTVQPEVFGPVTHGPPHQFSVALTLPFLLLFRFLRS